MNKWNIDLFLAVYEHNSRQRGQNPVTALEEISSCSCCFFSSISTANEQRLTIKHRSLRYWTVRPQISGQWALKNNPDQINVPIAKNKSKQKFRYRTWCCRWCWFLKKRVACDACSSIKCQYLKKWKFRDAKKDISMWIILLVRGLSLNVRLKSTGTVDNIKLHCWINWLLIQFGAFYCINK